MPSLIAIFVLGLFVYFDAAVLRRMNAELFRRSFRVPAWLFFLYIGMFTLLTKSLGRAEETLGLLLVFVFPVYVLMRRRFRRALSRDPAAAEIPFALHLASDAFTVLLQWFLWMVVFVIVVNVIGQLSGAKGSQLGEMILTVIVSSVLILGLIWRTSRRYPQLSLGELTGLKWPGRPAVQVVVIPALVGLAFSGLASAIILTREFQPATPLNQALESTTSSIIILAFVAIAVLMAPFVEEILFRGYFYYVLVRSRGRVFAIILIAAIFALLHVEQYWGDWQAIALVACLGLVLTLIRTWTSTTISSMTAHYVYNTSMMIIPFVVMLVSNPVYFQYQSMYQQLDPEGRVNLLMESIRQHPRHDPSYNDLAWLYAEEGIHLEEALRLIDTALEISPERFAYLDTRAEVLYKLGRIKEAVEVAEGLVNKYPDNVYAAGQLEKFLKALDHDGR